MIESLIGHLDEAHCKYERSHRPCVVCLTPDDMCPTCFLLWALLQEYDA